MIKQQHTHRYLFERIYEKLLDSDKSRTIKFENVQDFDRDVSLRNFNQLFRKLAENNYAHSKPRTKTWILVEDDPKKYAEFLDVSEHDVQELEKVHGRRDPEPKGVKGKGSMEDKY